MSMRSRTAPWLLVDMAVYGELARAVESDSKTVAARWIRTGMEGQELCDPRVGLWRPGGAAAVVAGAEAVTAAGARARAGGQGKRRRRRGAAAGIRT